MVAVKVVFFMPYLALMLTNFNDLNYAIIINLYKYFKIFKDLIV